MTLQELATGVGQAKDSYGVSPGTPKHPTPAPYWGCGCIRQSLRLLAFPKYLHQHHPIQWGGHKPGEPAEMCQARGTWGTDSPPVPSPSTAPWPGWGAQKGLSRHGMVLWDPGTPAWLQPSPALPGSCTGQGLSPGCLFPQLQGHRASWRHGSRALTPRKVGGFPGSGKKTGTGSG